MAFLATKQAKYMWSIFNKELNAFLNTLIAPIVLVVFLTGTGLFFWVFPESNVLDYGFAEMDTLFATAPYIYLFLIPAITMRTFAEEKKSGTLELLLTKPISDMQIILAKYFSSLVLVVLALLPTLLYYYSIYQLGDPKGNLDTPGIIGSYIGLFLLGAVFNSIGLFCSSLTENQIIAFIFSVFLCFLIFTGFTSLASINVWGALSPIIIKFGIEYHYQSLSKGLIDFRDLFYFFSVILLMLLATKLVLGSRNW
jgi:ABC-2 type transport system permease protein